MIQLLSLPEVLIETEEATLTAEDLQALSEVRVQQRLSLPTLCELTFSDPPGNLAGVAQLVPGTTLRVMVAGMPDPLFIGQVTAVEHCYAPDHGREIRVRGYDLLHQLRKRQSVRAHVQVTTRDLAQELVADLGLVVQAAEPGPLWARLIQHRQSDFELLQEVAEKCGLYLAVRGNTLHLLTLRGIGEAIPLLLGETLLEARIEVNADAPYRSVVAAGWDSSRIEAHKGQASQARVGRTVATELAPARVGGSGKREFVDEGTPNDDHATGIAQAELDLRVAREITLWGVAEGDPRLRPGTPVGVTGVADGVAGRYVLSAVTHRIDAQKGFLSEISSSPPPLRVRARSSVGAPGVVTQIDDPEKSGRIRVSLPTYGDVETDWMPVLSVGAGAKKGLMAFPDIGDHVLVLFAHEDPGQGVVLGGLYAGEKPPDVGIGGGAVQRYTLQTPGGQRIRLDDGQHTIRLENNDGSYCELAPQKVRLHSAVDLEIEAPGQRVVIRGRNIDFERG
jgi:phage baseplate assembly protein gpV/phage protein D